MLEKGNFINNRYEIISRVGAGGMSDVYKAKDHKLNRNVAIKVLKKEFSKDKNFVSKFRVEAQSAASLIHPNIVNVYDVGEDEGLYYIVMELIEGITLKSYIEKKKKLSVAEQKAEKYIYYGTIIGLVLGVILGFIGFILTDNMFWIALSPLILLFVGLGIGAILGKNKNLNTNKKVVKKQPHKNK